MNDKLLLKIKILKKKKKKAFLRVQTGEANKVFIKESCGLYVQ